MGIDGRFLGFAADSFFTSAFPAVGDANLSHAGGKSNPSPRLTKDDGDFSDRKQSGVSFISFSAAWT